MSNSACWALVDIMCNSVGSYCLSHKNHVVIPSSTTQSNYYMDPNSSPNEPAPTQNHLVRSTALSLCLFLAFSPFSLSLFLFFFPFLPSLLASFLPCFLASISLSLSQPVSLISFSHLSLGLVLSGWKLTAQTSLCYCTRNSANFVDPSAEPNDLTRRHPTATGSWSPNVLTASCVYVAGALASRWMVPGVTGVAGDRVGSYATKWYCVYSIV